MRSAAPEARAKLVDALERAGLNPRPELAKEKLLLAVGALRHAEAIPLVARSLDDRLEPGAVSDDDIPAILHEAATSANASIASYVAQNRDVAGMGATLIAQMTMP
jgi:hypothetical protein